MDDPNVTPSFGASPNSGYEGSEADTKQFRKTERLNVPPSQATAPQIQRFADELSRKVRDGQLPKGNLELAAVLGFKPAQLAMKRPQTDGMTTGQLIQFLLTDPNFKIQIDVSSPA